MSFDSKYKKTKFEDVRLWLGNRGVSISKGWLLAWHYDEKYLYYIPNKKKAPDWLVYDDPKFPVIKMYRLGLHAEVDDEISLEDSPFKGKTYDLD